MFKKNTPTHMPSYRAGNWNIAETLKLYKDLRLLVDTIGLENIEGNELLSYSITAGHFAISRIVMEPERDVVRNRLPLKLVHLIRENNPYTYQITLPFVDTRKRQPDPAMQQEIAPHRILKHKHIMFRATPITIPVPECEIMERDASTYKQKVCVQNCSITDIRINKKIIRIGKDVMFNSKLPNGQTASQFSIQYVYNEHIRRVLRKRKKKKNSTPCIEKVDDSRNGAKKRNTNDCQTVGSEEITSISN
jgi:hypothetical protein